ncbi:hypothetical protein RN001_008031 [Aquatica leii]|uniref:Uncharacterized protein n=1 Tax=Aquatica leii TaxID=1421715 RepID=A0AAN7SR73_9COLE|nr:hypothetical protein RN001_008031 [Aquatica leii]
MNTTHYGEHCIKPDLDKTEYAAQKEIFLNSLNRSVQEIIDLEKRTREQANYNDINTALVANSFNEPIALENKENSCKELELSKETLVNEPTNTVTGNVKFNVNTRPNQVLRSQIDFSIKGDCSLINSIISSKFTEEISTNMKFALIVLFAVLAVASAQFYHPYGYDYGYPHAYGHLYRSAHLVAPAVQTGYVAATRGSLHTAPLPEGPFAVSHHINTAPAPGTF